MRVGSAPVEVTITLEDGSTVSPPADDRPFDRTVFERKFGRTWPPITEDDKVLDEDGDPTVRLDLTDELWLFMAWVQINRAEIASGALKIEAFDAWYASVVDADWNLEALVVPAKPAEPTEGDVVPPTVPAPSSGA